MEWISTKDNPPKDEQVVLAFTSKGTIGFALLEKIGDTEWQFIPTSLDVDGKYEIWEQSQRLEWMGGKNTSVDNFDDEEFVTYWMPLPAAPCKEDK